MSAARRVSLAGADIAHALDEALEEIAGERVAFSLWVWTDGRYTYVSNAARDEIAVVVQECLDNWRAGIPDPPAHLVSS